MVHLTLYIGNLGISLVFPKLDPKNFSENYGRFLHTNIVVIIPRILEFSEKFFRNTYDVFAWGFISENFPYSTNMF